MRVATRLAPALALLAAACATHIETSRALRFSAPEGRVLNEFYRQGPVGRTLYSRQARRRAW